MNEIIRTHLLSKKYAGSERFAVNSLSFSVQQGEIVGLLGPNGAGKTTLLSILYGLFHPTSGEVFIDQLNYKQHKRKIQQLIGVVPQEYALYPTLTARENLSYFGSLYDIPKKELDKRIAAGLQQVGLSDFADKPIETFSGGMKRRINLLTGILHRPALLFLDEPTVGVDVQSKEVIIDLLKMLNNDGTTIIYTSHHLNEAQHFCTNILIIDGGQIIAQGAPEVLIRSVEGAVDLENVFISLTGSQLRDYA